MIEKAHIFFIFPETSTTCKGLNVTPDSRNDKGTIKIYCLTSRKYDYVFFTDRLEHFQRKL